MSLPAELAVFGKYRLKALLGEGGMAAVYRACADGLESDVAVKLLPPRSGGDETVRQRFLRETFTLATLSHPNIVPVLDYGEARDHLFYVMPLMEGESLQARLVRREPIPIEQVLRTCEDLLEATRYLHSQGLIHRDVTPANVMFDAMGRAVLMDFGLVRPDRGSNLTRTGSVLGTPRYIPPEVLKDGDVDQTSDLYQIGIVTYQSATGFLPYGDDMLLEMILEQPEKLLAPPIPDRADGSITPPVADFLLNAVEWKRERRYRDAEEMLEDLGRARSGVAVSRRKASFSPSRAIRLLKPGAVGGRYELLHGNRLAPGRDYYEATDPQGGAVLLRPLPPLAGSEEEALKVLAPYAGARHPALSRIRDLVLQGSQPFLVYDRPEELGFMEPPTGHDKLPKRKAARQISRLLEGLERLHERGLVHGEISLQNLMSGPGGQVRILGLGVQPLKEAGLLSVPEGDSTARVSTWMAPEQHEGGRALPASDVYAVGRLLSLLIHGRLLPASQVRQDAASVDPLLRCVARATAWELGERFEDASAFARALSAAQDGARGGRLARASRAVKSTVRHLVGDANGKPSWALAALAAAAIGVALAVLLWLAR